MAYLAVLQPDARAAARLSTALGGNHTVRVAATWRDLDAILDRGEADGVVVDADHPHREVAVTEIARLRQENPELAIVAYGGFKGEEQEIYRFGGLGVDGVIPAGRMRNTAVIRGAVNRAVAAARASRVADFLMDTHGALAAQTVSWAMEHASEGPSPRDMAQALGHTPHSLGAALRAAGLPGAGRIILWGRLLLVGAYLGRDGHTVEEAAFLVGYATASSLSRALKRETGAPPSEVAQEGGLRYVQRALFPTTPPRRGPRSGVIIAAILATQTACAGLSFGGGLVDGKAVDRVLDTPLRHQIHFGVLAVDATAWDSVTVGPTWEVEDLRYRYGSTGGAFALEHGELHVVVSGGESEGEPARVTWHPMGSSEFVSSEVLTAPPDSSTRVRHMAAGRHAEVYRHALAEPGEDGSTLSRRLQGLEGRVFAKTGTISNVNSLSGYLVRDDGREVVFSILSNGSGLPSSQVRAAIDDVVRVLAR